MSSTNYTKATASNNTGTIHSAQARDRARTGTRTGTRTRTRTRTL